MSQTITDVWAREILDSRGNPTIEVEVELENGTIGRAAIPSGASTGENEAVELRDGDKTRYLGKGVLKAVENVNEIIGPELIELDATEQIEIDELMIELDETDNKSNLGANAILGVSVAVAKAAADSVNLPLYRYFGGSNAFTLPVPTMNVLNGGKHAGNELAIQEFMVQPKGAETFYEALQFGAEIYQTLGKLLEKKYGRSSTNVGYEGGYAPKMSESTEALDALVQAIEEAGYTESEVTIGIDAAASEFYEDELYAIDGKKLTAPELLDYYVELVNSYPILSIEDPFYEEAYEDFEALTNELWDTIIVGDDLFVTNIERLSKGVDMGAANALLLKINQIGTLSEAFDAASMAARNGYTVIVSHRSAETEDTTISDLAVAIGAEMIKTGAPARGERTAKYNQLLRIEEDLGEVAHYVQL